MTKEQEKVLATIADFKATFSTPHGKRVLRRLMKNTGFEQTNFVAGDAYATAFNEGGRNVIIYILSQLKFDLKQLEQQLSGGIENVGE